MNYRANIQTKAGCLASLCVACVSALASDFATTVESYVQGGPVPLDFITFDSFNNPASALGTPTVDTTSDSVGGFGGSVPAGEIAPVVPPYGPFRSFELVAIGAGGHLTVSFDHKILDDPSNPYGSDFIIFGNPFMNGNRSWDNRDPETFILSGVLGPSEKGAVSVSQDGTNWFAMTNAPFADDQFAPTLGRQYDPENVETNLGAWNLWWGDPANPTLPVSPAVVASNVTGWSLAKLARHYGESAGGTAFDISSLSLPLDPVSGFKWIQFVRVESLDGEVPEIDAFSDVAPVSPYRLWKTEEFSWLLDPVKTLDDADPDLDRIPNILEYGLGLDPEATNDHAGFNLKLDESSDPPQILVEYMKNAQAVDVVLQVERATALEPLSWSTQGIDQAVSTGPVTNGLMPVSAGPVMSSTDLEFFRLTVGSP